ncbi:MAG TPA: hypothetical protein VNI77_01960 [Nitrososphaera sp.]|nr:hypothetical protein [Nitrososphaera sp.]
MALLVDPTTSENGSGVLIQIRDRIFILTAAHVLSNNIHINLGLPWQRTPFTILDSWTDPSLDIGFLELKPFEVDILRIDAATPYKITSKQATEIRAMTKSLALCGYPTVQHTVLENAVMYTPAFLGCAMVHPDNWPASLLEKGKTPERNIAIAYGEKHGGRFFDPDGNPLHIHPKGMSGCGIWFFDPTDEQAENPPYALVAIQHSYFPQDQVIVGTFAEPIIDAICNHYGFSLQN